MINENMSDMDAIYLIGLVLQEIGLYFDNNGVIIDQDTNVPMKFEDNILLFSNNPVIVSDTKERMIFNPLINFKLMNMMMSYYLQKINYLDGKYFPIMYTDKEPPEEEKIALHLKDPDNGIHLSTRYYNNIILAYIEALGKINGNDYDLTMYDNSEPYRKKRR